MTWMKKARTNTPEASFDIEFITTPPTPPHRCSLIHNHHHCHRCSPTPSHLPPPILDKALLNWHPTPSHLPPPLQPHSESSSSSNRDPNVFIRVAPVGKNNFCKFFYRSGPRRTGSTGIPLVRPCTSTASSMILQASSNSNGNNHEDLAQHDIGMLKAEASLNYLCNLTPHRYEHIYVKNLPESMSGEAFLKEYKDHNDSATVINGKRTYAIKAATEHPIYENFRVKAFKALLTSSPSEDQLTTLGELLYQCHYSYSACGLGSDGTNRLIQLVQEMQHNGSTPTDGTLYGAKITGGGSGGTICVLGKDSPQSRERITQIQKRYQNATGYKPFVFEGSSPGAGKFGYLKIRSRKVHEKK